MIYLNEFKKLDDLQNSVRNGQVGYPWVLLETQDRHYLPVPTSVEFDLNLNYPSVVPGSSTKTIVVSDKTKIEHYDVQSVVDYGTYHDMDYNAITYPANTDTETTKTISGDITWNASATIQNDEVVTSTLTENYSFTQDVAKDECTVKFFNEDGVTEITSYTVEIGSTIVAPVMPAREGYTFSWTPAFNPIANFDVNYVATYTVVPGPEPTPTGNALKFTATEASTLSMSKNGSPRDITLSKSTDGVNWSTWDMSEISLASDESVYIKGDNPNGLNNQNNYYYFVMTGKLNCEGNVMSLLGEDVTEIPIDYCFNALFSGCTSLVKAPELPATTLTTFCYFSMFNGCTSLVDAPELPATILSQGCYNNMFNGCTSLVDAPELPATTLNTYCYSNMFRGCSSLVTAPRLLATTLASGCYSTMFRDCKSLVNAPELPATTLTQNCYSNMFLGCISLVTAPELLATTLADFCYDNMFNGCTSLVNVPSILPATTLKKRCYYSMFSSCKSLVTAPELPAIDLVENCYNGMFSSCSKLNYIKALFVTEPSNTLTYYWVNGVASSGTFVKNAAATWDVKGNSGVPNNWDIKTINPL